MLALPLALLLALPASEISPAGARVPQPPPPPPSLIPYGTASGTWVAGTLLQDGVLVALLEDAAGRPLFVLDARLTATGEISGELRHLQYLTNPALGLPPLAVVGEAQLPAVGPGRFWGTIFTPLGGPIPVQPFGRIEGILTRGLRRTGKPGLAGGLPASGTAGHGTLVPNGHGVVCSKGPGVSEVRAAGSHSQPGGGQSVPGLIVCPHAPGAELIAQSIGGPVVAAGGQVTAPQGQPVLSGQVALAPHSPVGHSSPPAGEGTARARWYLLP